MINDKALAQICLILPFWSQNFPLWFGQQKKHGNYLQCGTESIPTQADDCGPGGLSSQESQPNLTTTYPTIPNQPHHTIYTTQCHALLPYHAMQYHTVQRSRCLSHPVSSHKKSFSPCRLFYMPPLDLFLSKISFFACVICWVFWWTTLKYPFIYYSKWLAFFHSQELFKFLRARQLGNQSHVAHEKAFSVAPHVTVFYLIFSFLYLHV